MQRILNVGGAYVMFILLMAVSSMDQIYAANFQGLGDLPGGIYSSRAYGVSADGSVVVGMGTSASGEEAIIWTEQGGMTSLGIFPGGDSPGCSTGVSADGRVIIGSVTSSIGLEAFVWTPTDGMVDIGISGYGRGISGDGKVLVGIGPIGAYRWTKTEGMVGLGSPGNSDAYKASFDGSVIVGTRNTSTGTEAMKWTASQGMVGLGNLPGENYGCAYDVSDDGKVIIGNVDSESGMQAFRWTESDGMVGLGTLPGGEFGTWADAVSGDGSIIVGESGGQAFIWEAVHGMRNLKQVLQDDFGLDLDGWKLWGASDISSDGTHIVGCGTDPQGNYEGWIVTIPEPSTITLLGICAILAYLHICRKNLKIH